MNYLTNSTMKILSISKKLFRIFLSASLLASCTQPSTNKTEAEKDASTVAHDSIFSPANLQEQMIYSRAIQTVIWSMPAVNYELMHQALVRETKGSFNQIVYWS